MFSNDEEAPPPYLPPERKRADTSTQAPSRLMKYKSWSPGIDREETWLRRKNLHKERRRAAIHGRKLDGSVTDEDLDELRACIDLGFGLGFGDEDTRSDGSGSSSRLAETFPALDLYYAVNQNRSDLIAGDGATVSDSSSNGSSPLRLYTPGDSSDVVKARLKQWAQVVACSMLVSNGDSHCTGSLSNRRQGESDNFRFTKDLSAQEEIPNENDSIDAIQHSEKLDSICEPRDPPFGLMDVDQVIKNVNEGTVGFIMEGELSKMVDNINICNFAKGQIPNKDDTIDANQHSEILQRHEEEKLIPNCKFDDPTDGQMNVDYHVKNSNSEEMGGDLSQIVGNIKEGCIIALMASEDDEKIEILQHTDSHPRKLRKRKYKIMNNKQIMMIEKELVKEPDMQRNASLLKSWAEKLSRNGSKLTPSQLKNWINNRKAKLARATRETRAQSEGGNNIPDQSIIAHFYDSAENGGEKYKYFNSNSKKVITSFNDSVGTSSIKQSGQAKNPSGSNFLQLKLDQFVSIIDGEGKEVGRGRIYQTEGEWHGENLEKSRMCVVCIVELKVEKSTSVQWPSEYSGTTFEEAATRNGGNMQVLWNTSMIIPLVE